MAERRMFAKAVVLSDAFMDLPVGAKYLYFTLGMYADDDGFVSNPKSIMRQCESTQADIDILEAKRYILRFDSGVIAIKHWRMNNYLRSDRYQPTTYVEEKNTLALDQKGAYVEADKVGIPPGIPNMGIPRIGKDRIEKDKNNVSVNKKIHNFSERQIDYQEIEDIVNGKSN